MVSPRFPTLSKHATNIGITNPTPHPTLINHLLHLVLLTQAHMLIGEIPLRMTVKTRMMMMMVMPMTCFWPPNLLNSCHSYPKYMMSNPQIMIFWMLPATGEIQMRIPLIKMLNAHLKHEPRLTGSPSTRSPTHPLSNLQPKHSSLALVSTAPMISSLQSN